MHSPTYRVNDLVHWIDRDAPSLSGPKRIVEVLDGTSQTNPLLLLQDEQSGIKLQVFQNEIPNHKP